MNQTADDEWHLMIQARPTDVGAGPTLTICNTKVPTLDLKGQPVTEPLAVRFDAVLSSMDQLGMFVEGDGSFCWTAPGAAWRIYGEIYDGHETVQYVELKGKCPGGRISTGARMYVRSEPEPHHGAACSRGSNSLRPMNSPASRLRIKLLDETPDQ